MAKRKATHFGECQVCGNRQKLPYGLLAKHGYTKGYGFFEGTCTGSDELPFEQSCDLVEDSILRAKALLKVHSEFAEKLRQLPDESVKTAYVNHYFTNRDYSRHANKSGYYFINAEVSLGKYPGRYNYTGKLFGNDVKGEHDIYVNTHDTLPKLIQYLNDKYCVAVIDKKVNTGSEYIAGATDRVENWKPRELATVK